MCMGTSHLITTDREAAPPRFDFRREDQLFSEFTQAHRVQSYKSQEQAGYMTSKEATTRTNAHI